MPRSAVLRGRIDARDRAQQRSRGDRHVRPAPDPYVAMDSWLSEAGLSTLPRAGAERLDLDRFLAETNHVRLAPAERLRQLAIALEGDFYAHAPHAIDRVYEAALHIEPDDAMLWHSRGVSARCAADGANHPRGHGARKWRERARRYLHRAWELHPHDASVAYSLGIWHYFSSEGATAAEPWFDQALALDPKHALARLYRAHCLHDQERWQDAVSAYEEVPLGAFEGARAWLVDVVLEAKAHCRLHAGDPAGAEAEFTRLLERLQREPHRAEALQLVYLEDACRGAFAATLGPRFAGLEERLGLAQP